MAPPWLRIIEIFLTQQLLRSPTFHRMVQSIHKRGHELRHGKDPAELGGTNIEEVQPKKQDPDRGFIKYFFEELSKQARGTTDSPPPPPKQIDNKLPKK